MKKIYILLTMFLVSGVILVSGVSADWEPTGNKMCNSTGTSVAGMPERLHLPGSMKDKALADIGHLCFVNRNYNIAWYSSFAVNNILYCKLGEDPPLKNGDYTEAGVCCPSSHPYYAVKVGGGAVQCADSSDNRVSTIPPISQDTYREIWKLSTKIMVHGSAVLTNPTIDEYECNINAGDAGKCVINNSTGEIDSRTIVSASEIGSYSCVDGGSTVGSNTCYKNGLYDTELYNSVGIAGMAILAKCGGMPNGQSDQCVKCLQKNYVKEDGKIVTKPNYSFSSAIGCIETSISGLVIRMFQIGIGIGSGVAIIRIIQGALLRQTNDPAKIQEGNQIIFTTLAAILTLVSAVTIMRIIGVDILMIFTSVQFDAIIN